MTIFGMTFSGSLLFSVAMGCFAMWTAIDTHDPFLAFLSGGLVTMPFAFLIGSASGRADERKKRGGL